MELASFWVRVSSLVLDSQREKVNTGIWWVLVISRWKSRLSGLSGFE